MIDGVRRRLKKSSLTKVAPAHSVQMSTGSTGVPTSIVQEAEKSVGTHSTSGRGLRVLTLFEFVHDLRATCKNEKLLNDKLYEIEKMILGLALE